MEPLLFWVLVAVAIFTAWKVFAGVIRTVALIGVLIVAAALAYGAV